MPNPTMRITLLAPGCFSALAHNEEVETGSDHNNIGPETNVASVLSTNTQVYEQALAKALAQPVPAVGELPIAAYQYPMDTGDAAPTHCVCAEFVHFQADKDNAHLIPSAALNIDNAESEALLESLNTLIESDGLQLQSSLSGQCYLTGMPADGLDTMPAHAVANGKIAGYLPRHAEAGPWRRLITEVQMLFHAHAVNDKRSSLQQLPINGMWFWGGATAASPVPAPNIVLVADDAYALGMGMALDIDMLSPESNSLQQLLDRYVDNQSIDSVVIVEMSTYHAWLRGDHSALMLAKQDLQQQWIEPVQKAVADGLVSEFVLDGCEGQSIIEHRSGASSSGLFSWIGQLRSMGTSLPKRLRRGKS